MTLFGPLSAIGLTLTYYDLRARKEAFDLMMDLRSAEIVSTHGAQQSALGSH